jgi:hypothetical protein
MTVIAWASGPGNQMDRRVWVSVQCIQPHTPPIVLPYDDAHRMFGEQVECLGPEPKEVQLGLEIIGSPKSHMEAVSVCECGLSHHLRFDERKSSIIGNTLKIGFDDFRQMATDLGETPGFETLCPCGLYVKWHSGNTEFFEEKR